MKRIALILAAGLILSACNSTGNYQSYQAGVGYASEQNDENVYTVTYTGTRSTKIEKVNDFALLRSAELTLEKGYKYFVIEEATNNRDATVADAGTLHEALNESNSGNFGPGQGGGFFGGPSSGPSTPNRPRAESTLVIHLFNEQPDTISYDASLIERALKNEYEIADQPSL